MCAIALPCRHGFEWQGHGCFEVDEAFRVMRCLGMGFARGCGTGVRSDMPKRLSDEVTLRVESGEMAGLQTLLLEHNPEYARLSFGDPASSKGYEGKQGWSLVQRGQIFRLQASSQRGKWVLLLDGSCNWLVRDLVQMKDESFSIMENTNNGAFPANYNEDFFLWGYGYYRYNQNWLKWDLEGTSPMGSRTTVSAFTGT